MTDVQIFAFVILPVFVMAAGYVVVLVTEHAQRRHERLHSGE